MAIIVQAGGRRVSYKTVSVTGSMKDGTRSFTMEVSDKDRGLYPGTAITIIGDSGQMLLDGFVNQYSTKFDANSHAITVAGRSASQDSADSSADHPTGQFKKKTAVEISNELAGKVGNSYTTKLSLPKIEQYNINQGENIHQIALRLADNYGCTIMSLGNNTMEFCTAESATRGGMVGEGIFPTLSGSGDLNDSTAHSSYEYRSQLGGREEKYGEEASQGVAKASGSHKRTRPFIGIADKSQDKAQSKKRADWKARRKEGSTKKCSFTIQGDDLQGSPVIPNQTVWCASPWLGINQEMLIESCTWNCAEGSGTTTSIDLVAPEAYAGKSSSASKKSAGSADSSSPNANASSTSSDAATANRQAAGTPLGASASPYAGLEPGSIQVGKPQ